MPPTEFEPAIPVIELVQTYASDRAVIGASYRVEAPRISKNLHMEVVRLLVLATGSQYASPPNPAGTHFCKRQSRPQGLLRPERTMTMKNSSNNWNRTRDLHLAFSPVSQQIKFTKIKSKKKSESE
jgi:hypothetical protein